MNQLSTKKCTPCEGKTKPLTREEAQNFLKQTPGWELDDSGKKISRKFVMKNFLAAVDLIRKVADVAEADDHHPDVHLTRYRQLLVELSTHAVDGLSENDFILAAKINELPAELKG
jgi:4a-hydroxytetrahydrobiopterin dehydratase